MTTTENTRDFVNRVLSEMQSVEAVRAHPQWIGDPIDRYDPLPVVEDETYDGIANCDIFTPDVIRWNLSRAQAHRDEHGDARLAYVLEGVVLMAAVLQVCAAELERWRAAR